MMLMKISSHHHWKKHVLWLKKQAERNQPVPNFAKWQFSGIKFLLKISKKLIVIFFKSCMSVVMSNAHVKIKKLRVFFECCASIVMSLQHAFNKKQ